MLGFIICIIFLSTFSQVQTQTTYGCEMGWQLFGQYCYRAVSLDMLGVWTTTMTFDQGRDYCKSNGGDLVSIHNAFENTFIQTNLSLINGHRYYIGLQINGQNLSWSDGTSFDYNNLNTSVLMGSGFSAYFSLGLKWTPVPSTNLLEGRICKRAAIPNMPPIHNGSALGYWGTHDPTMLKTQDGQYIHYRTQYNVSASISIDRQTFYKNGSAFPGGIPWARNWTFQTPDDIWAPDVRYHNGKYYMYYSAWRGETIAAIGLAISESGRPGEWVDQGMVFNSLNTTFNAIDPDLLIDTDGRWYLVFGSYLSGIYQYEMDPNTGFIKEGATPVHLAHRGDDRDDAIEGSGMFKKDSYYYLFFTFDYCCRGLKSTYRTMVGRSTSPQGPFLDKQGKSMLEGGGSELLVTVFPIIGPGGVYLFSDTDHDLIVFHYYDGLNNGSPRLSINYVGWTEDGWPYVY